MRKAAFACYHHVIISSRTVNYLHITPAVKTTDHTNVAVVRIKYQITRFSLRPAYSCTIAVLAGRAAASAHYETATAGVIEYPIHKTAAIQTKGPHCTGGNAAGRPYLLRRSPAAVPAQS